MDRTNQIREWLHEMTPAELLDSVYNALTLESENERVCIAVAAACGIAQKYGAK